MPIGLEVCRNVLDLCFFYSCFWNISSASIQRIQPTNQDKPDKHIWGLAFRTWLQSVFFHWACPRVAISAVFWKVRKEVEKKIGKNSPGINLMFVNHIVTAVTREISSFSFLFFSYIRRWWKRKKTHKVIFSIFLAQLASKILQANIVTSHILLLPLQKKYIYKIWHMALKNILLPLKPLSNPASTSLLPTLNSSSPTQSLPLSYLAFFILAKKWSALHGKLFKYVQLLMTWYCAELCTDQFKSNLPEDKWSV